jgi:hypothetical protein
MWTTSLDLSDAETKTKIGSEKGMHFTTSTGKQGKKKTALIR